MCLDLQFLLLQLHRVFKLRSDHPRHASEQDVDLTHIQVHKSRIVIVVIVIRNSR